MAKSKTNNPTSRVRTIELEGKRYTVEYAAAAYDAMFNLTGISLLKGWDESTEWDMREYTCFLYSGLLKHHSDDEDLLKFCYDALDGAALARIKDDLFGAYIDSMPKLKDEPANPKKPVAKS